MEARKHTVIAAHTAIVVLVGLVLATAAACETADGVAGAQQDPGAYRDPGEEPALAPEYDPGEALAAEWGIGHPMVIAHRGASGIAPESTRAAYEIARDLGADYLEADIQQTSDGELVAFHDDAGGENYLTRTSNVEDVFPDRTEDEIQDFTLDELRELDYGSWFNDEYPEYARDSYEGLGIVTLEELIEIAEEGGNNPGLYLETKSAPNHPGIEENMIETLEVAGWLPDGPDLNEPDHAGSGADPETNAPAVDYACGPAPIIFQSFHDGSVETLRNLAPDNVPVIHLLSGDVAEQAPVQTPPFASTTVLGADGIGPWHGAFDSADDILEANEHGLLVHHYTVNDTADMRGLRAAGSDGIFTDFPHLALEEYGLSPGEIDVGRITESLGY